MLEGLVGSVRLAINALWVKRRRGGVTVEQET